MNIRFRITSGLIDRIRRDLRRPHTYAAERVGFIAARPARLSEGGVVVLAYDYRPLNDGDYAKDSTVGAMMNCAAIRSALQFAYDSKAAMFHVHMHAHWGRPSFSSIDLSETSKFVPDFFHVAPRIPHGALVLSSDGATGLCWLSETERPFKLIEIGEVGATLRISR